MLQHDRGDELFRGLHAKYVEDITSFVVTQALIGTIRQQNHDQACCFSRVPP